MEPFGYIYITTNLVDGKRYLGMCRYGKRKETTYLGSGKLLKEAIATYGTGNFTKEVLEVCFSRKELSIREMHYISEYGCVDSPDWYNIAHGGYSTRGFQGKAHSDETKAKMRENYKRPITDKTREGFREGGRKNVGKAQERRMQLLAEGNPHHRAVEFFFRGKWYKSLKEAQDDTGLSQSTLSYHYKKYKASLTPELSPA